MKFRFIIILFCMVLQACTQVGDYLLGKDNTPKPTPLAEIKPKLRLTERWSVPVSRSNKIRTYLKLKPVIRGNVIYIASVGGQVQAIDKTSGKLVWSTQMSQGIVSGPTVSEGFIAVGTNASTVILLQQSDGRKLSTLKVSGDVLSKPLITNHTVLAKTIDGRLYAFDLKTGAKRWMSEHGSPSLILKASASPVTLGNNLVLVGFSDGQLDAVDITSGRVVWQRSIAYASGSSDVERLIDIVADPIVGSNAVYLASYQGYVGALSLTSGEFAWRKPASVYKNMATDGETLYITDSDDIVWALNTQNGRVKWKQLALKSRGVTEPIVLGNRLILGDKMGYLHVLSTQNGELIGRTQLSAPIDIAPALSSNSIYVLTANGKLNRLMVS